MQTGNWPLHRYFWFYSVELNSWMQYSKYFIVHINIWTINKVRKEKNSFHSASVGKIKRSFVPLLKRIKEWTVSIPNPTNSIFHLNNLGKHFNLFSAFTNMTILIDQTTNHNNHHSKYLSPINCCNHLNLIIFLCCCLKLCFMLV